MVGNETLTSFSILFDFSLNPDPKIAGSFTLQNLSGTTQTFTVTRHAREWSAIAGPTTMSGFYGEATFTDLNGNGVILASPLFYQARIDGGGVQSLGNFTLSGSPGTSGTTSQETFGPEAGPGRRDVDRRRLPRVQPDGRRQGRGPLRVRRVVPSPVSPLCSRRWRAFFSLALQERAPARAASLW